MCLHPRGNTHSKKHGSEKSTCNVSQRGERTTKIREMADFQISPHRVI